VNAIGLTQGAFKTELFTLFVTLHTSAFNPTPSTP